MSCVCVYLGNVHNDVSEIKYIYIYIYIYFFLLRLVDYYKSLSCFLIG